MTPEFLFPSAAHGCQNNLASGKPAAATTATTAGHSATNTASSSSKSRETAFDTFGIAGRAFHFTVIQVGNGHQVFKIMSAFFTREFKQRHSATSSFQSSFWGSSDFLKSCGVSDGARSPIEQALGPQPGFKPSLGNTKFTRTK